MCSVASANPCISLLTPNASLIPIVLLVGASPEHLPPPCHSGFYYCVHKVKYRNLKEIPVFTKVYCSKTGMTWGGCRLKWQILCSFYNYMPRCCFASDYDFFAQWLYLSPMGTVPTFGPIPELIITPTPCHPGFYYCTRKVKYRDLNLGSGSRQSIQWLGRNDMRSRVA